MKTEEGVKRSEVREKIETREQWGWKWWYGGWKMSYSKPFEILFQISHDLNTSWGKHWYFRFFNK